MTQTVLKSKDVPQIMPAIAAFKKSLGDDLVAVVLFGSRARGQAHEMSDWDLFVVARRLPEKSFQRYLYLKKMLPDIWRGQIAIVAKTLGEFEAYLPSLFLDIALDGIILFDSDDYMAERLARLRRLIQAEGLQREQVAGDLLWRWQKFPGFDWLLEWEMAS